MEVQGGAGRCREEQTPPPIPNTVVQPFTLNRAQPATSQVTDTRTEGHTENGLAQKLSIFEAGGFEIKLFQVIIYNFCKRV